MALNFSGKQDVYKEIAERFEGYIKGGLYSAGDKLPSVRMVADDLGVNPNTVAKAYALLEENGFIRAIPKKGVFVTYGDGTSTKIGEELRIEVRKFLTSIKQQGWTYESLILEAKEVFRDDDQN